VGTNYEPLNTFTVFFTNLTAEAAGSVYTFLKEGIKGFLLSYKAPLYPMPDWRYSKN